MPDPNYELKPGQQAYYETVIDQMTQQDCARFYRFADSGNPIIQSPVLWERFMARFNETGGMTPAVSKAVGWG